MAIGGYGEVGRNCLAVNIDGNIVILDLGLKMDKYVELVDSEEYAPLSGRILIEKKAAPDISIIKKLKGKVIALCVSHAHLDHIGAIPYLANRLNTEIHATPFTAEVIYSLTEGERKELRNDVVEHEPDEKYEIAKDIYLQFIHITHSCPGTAVIVLHTKYGQVVYCNDFKLDENPTLGKKTDIKSLNELKDVKLLILNSLYSSTEGHTSSESIASQWIKEIMKMEELKGKKIIMTTFSSHIARLKSMYEAAKSVGRKVVFMGRSMHKYLTAAENIGLVNFSIDAKVIPYSRQATRFLQKTKDKEKYVFIVTGNQGEPNSLLSKMVAKNNFDLRRDDVVVFSSKVIPTPVNKRNREILERELRRFQVRIFRDIHVSGHGSKEDEKEIIKMTKPKFIIPVHADPQKLKILKETAVSELNYNKEDIKIIRNGEIVKIV